MTTDSTTPSDETTLFLGEAWSDPIEAGIRDRIRVFIEELIEEELAAALGRERYERRRRDGGIRGIEATDGVPLSGHRHATASDGSPAPLARSRSPFHGRALAPLRAGPMSGRARC